MGLLETFQNIITLNVQVKNQVVMKFKDQAKHKTLFYFFLSFEKNLRFKF
jgi:hypothetical protein